MLIILVAGITGIAHGILTLKFMWQDFSTVAMVLRLVGVRLGTTGVVRSSVPQMAGT
jgi:hypothetical protein